MSSTYPSIKGLSVAIVRTAFLTSRTTDIAIRWKSLGARVSKTPVIVARVSLDAVPHQSAGASCAMPGFPGGQSWLNAHREAAAETVSTT